VLHSLPTFDLFSPAVNFSSALTQMPLSPRLPCCYPPSLEPLLLRQTLGKTDRASSARPDLPHAPALSLSDGAFGVRTDSRDCLPSLQRSPPSARRRSLSRSRRSSPRRGLTMGLRIYYAISMRRPPGEHDRSFLLKEYNTFFGPASPLSNRGSFFFFFFFSLLPRTPPTLYDVAQRWLFESLLLEALRAFLPAELCPPRQGILLSSFSGLAGRASPRKRSKRSGWTFSPAFGSPPPSKHSSFLLLRLSPSPQAGTELSRDAARSPFSCERCPLLFD